MVDHRRAACAVLRRCHDRDGLLAGPAQGNAPVPRELPSRVRRPCSRLPLHSHRGAEYHGFSRASSRGLGSIHRLGRRGHGARCGAAEANRARVGRCAEGRDGARRRAVGGASKVRGKNMCSLGRTRAGVCGQGRGSLAGCGCMAGAKRYRARRNSIGGCQDGIGEDLHEPIRIRAGVVRCGQAWDRKAIESRGGILRRLDRDRGTQGRVCRQPS